MQLALWERNDFGLRAEFAAGSLTTEGQHWGRMPFFTRGKEVWCWIQMWKKEPRTWPPSWKASCCHHTRGHWLDPWYDLGRLLHDRAVHWHRAGYLPGKCPCKPQKTPDDEDITKLVWPDEKHRFSATLEGQPCHFLGGFQETSPVIWNHGWNLGPRLQETRENLEQ